MRPLLVATVLLGLSASTGIAESTGGSVAEVPVHFYREYISDLRYGHCRFEPSCSQYALDAVEKHGALMGAALAADRLIRCSPAAHSYHAQDANGKLVDPVDHLARTPSEPRAPRWLLPQLDHSFPHESSITETQSRIHEYVTYGGELTDEGDCWRAESEYGRAGFLAGTSEARNWANWQAGSCYFRWEDWDGAADRFLEVAETSPRELERGRAYLMAAASRFNAGEFTKSARMLPRSFDEADGNNSTVVANHPGESPELVTNLERMELLAGLSSMALGDWDDGARRFERVGAESRDAAYRDRALFLRWKAEEGTDLPRKRPNLAAGLSSVIPGSGQIYTGKKYDGIRHLLVNGTLIYGVYRLVESESYAGAYLLAGFTLPFYMGNVAGAKRSAQAVNAAERAEYVAGVIVEAGRQ